MLQKRTLAIEFMERRQMLTGAIPGAGDHHDSIDLQSYNWGQVSPSRPAKEAAITTEGAKVRAAESFFNVFDEVDLPA